MLRYLRSALPAVLCLLIAGGASYAMTAATEDPPSETPAEETTPPGEGDNTVTDPAPTDPPADDEVPTEDPVTEPVVDPAPEAGTGEETDVSEEAADDAKFSTEGCPEGFTGNHGQYVSSTQDRPRNEAAKSSCGKPVKDDDAEDETTDEEVADTDEPEDSNGHGKGKGKNKDAAGDDA
jgi:hypothetical protein